MKKINENQIRSTLLAVFASILLVGCSSANHGAMDYGYDAEGGIHDPFEDMNRTTLAVNEAVDKALLEPVAKGYRTFVPSPARTGIRNFLRNLRTPVNAGNQLLQGDVEGFARDLTRFTANTSIGLGGLIDVADNIGLPYEHEDFGQTLAVWGAGHGAYLVLPMIGPSSVRDGTGLIVDTYADPLRHYMYNVDRKELDYVRVGMTALDTRTELLDALDDLRRNSFDYYATLRSAYYQRRAAMVRDEHDGSFGVAEIPDYDE